MSVNLETATGPGVVAGFKNINKVVGSSSATDTLTGPVAVTDHTDWVLTGANAGTVDGTAFASFENLTGQDSTSDAFIFLPAGSLSSTASGGTGSLDGFAVADGAGNLTAYQPAGPDVAVPAGVSVAGKTVKFAGMDAYSALSGNNTHRVFTGTIFDRNVTLADGTANDGNMLISFSNFAFHDASATSYVIANPSNTLTLITGSGPDTITVSSTDAGFAGALLQFSQGVLKGTLTGVADTAALALVAPSNDGGLVLTLTVNGNANTLGSTAVGVKRVELDGLGGADGFAVDQVLPIEVSIVGGLDNDTLTGPILGMGWEITGADSGSADGVTSFEGIENLTGRNEPDRFNVRDDGVTQGSISGVITGGGGLDTLIGPDVNNTWNLTGANSGVLNGSTDYAGIENLTGGFAADTFNMAAAGSLSGTLDGGLDKAMTAGGSVAATDTLSYAAYGSAVTVNRALASATGITALNRVDAFVGSSSADTLVGPEGPGVIDAAANTALAYLPTGTVVRVIEAAGTQQNIYEYIGASTIDSNPATPALDAIDLTAQNYADTNLWKPINGHVNWNVSAPNAGEVEGSAFSSFENLTGRGATSDFFLFAAGGSLSGTVGGGLQPGTDSNDGFAVSNGVDMVAFQPTTNEQGGTAVMLGRTIQYAGMDPFTPFSGSAAAVVINGTVFNDKIVLEDASAASTGQMKVTFLGLSFYTGLATTNGSFTFANPTESLTILAGSGGDTITVKSMDPAFAAELLLYGNKAGAPTIEPDAGHDVISFESDVFTHGGYLEAFADDISVAAGKTLSTELNPGDLSDADDIVFRARRIGTPEIENLLPSGYLSKSVSINIGTGASLRAANIYLVAQAEDRALATTLGLSTLESQFFLDPAVSFLQDLVSLPIKVLIKAAEAHVTIGAGAQILAGDVIGIYATAGADASAQAKSQLFSLGYSQADATAVINVLGGALIEGGGPVNLTSAANATANMSTETSREEQGSVPGKKSSGFAASIAVSWARLTSTATLAPTAYVHGGRTVNIRALGEVESEAESESGLYADGTAALSLALQFSTANILTKLDGKVQADMNTNGGEVVKFEFDPTVKAAGLTSAQTSNRLVGADEDLGRPGDTVQVLVEVPVSLSDNPAWSNLAMPAGTVFEYIGPDVAGSSISLGIASQNYRNPDLWRVTSEPWGYVDFANNRISVHNTGNQANNWVVVTEDTADYSSRRGKSIGGLDSGQTYTVISLADDPLTELDESHYVQLARTEQLAIDGVPINLLSPAEEQGIALAAALLTGNLALVALASNADNFKVTTNNRHFNADATSIDGDKITLQQTLTEFNPFELGPAVNYYEPGHD